MRIFRALIFGDPMYNVVGRLDNGSRPQAVCISEKLCPKSTFLPAMPPDVRRGSALPGIE